MLEKEIKFKFEFKYITQKDIDSIEEQITKYEREYNCKLELNDYINEKIYIDTRGTNGIFNINIIHENDEENCCFTIVKLHLESNDIKKNKYNKELYRYLRYKLIKRYKENYD